jgi:hypothetical protein
VLRKSVIICVVVTGCASHPGEPVHVDVPLQLADLPDLYLYFYGTLSDPEWVPNKSYLSATLEYSSTQLADDDSNTQGCAVLDESLTATLNGVPLEIDGRGGWTEFESEPCHKPIVVFNDVPDSLKTADAELVFADASRTITANLGDTFVPRTAIPLGAEDWQFKQGEEVTLQWSPASDLTSASANLRFLRGTESPHGFVDFSIYEGFTRGPDTISFTLPDRIWDGAVAVDFFGNNSTLRCPDVTCRMNLGRRVYHEAHIAP